MPSAPRPPTSSQAPPGLPGARRRRLSREEACGILRGVLLLAPETAEAYLGSIEVRAYPAAVSEGYRRVRDYVGSDPARRWERFARILTEPLMPADLAGTP